jgi:hypothetical protein
MFAQKHMRLRKSLHLPQSSKTTKQSTTSATSTHCIEQAAEYWDQVYTAYALSFSALFNIRNLQAYSLEPQVSLTCNTGPGRSGVPGVMGLSRCIAATAHNCSIITFCKDVSPVLTPVRETFWHRVNRPECARVRTRGCIKA